MTKKPKNNDKQIFEEAVKKVAYFLNFKLEKQFRGLLGPIYSSLNNMEWQMEQIANRLAAPMTMSIVDTSLAENAEFFNGE